MKLVTSEKVEYRLTKEVPGKNGTYYLHTFEDPAAMEVFTFYSKDSAAALSLKRGDLYYIEFSVSLYGGKTNFMFNTAYPEKGKVNAAG